VTSSGSDLAVTVRRDGEASVLVVSGEVDMATAPTLARHVEAVLSEQPGAVVVDLERVTYLASAGITALVQLTIDTHTAKIPCCLVATDRVVLRPLELTGVAPSLVIHPTLDAARSWLRDQR
jgi:anti-sigma B factor antagonist